MSENLIQPERDNISPDEILETCSVALRMVEEGYTLFDAVTREAGDNIEHRRGDDLAEVFEKFSASDQKEVRGFIGPLLDVLIRDNPAKGFEVARTLLNDDVKRVRLAAVEGLDPYIYLSPTSNEPFLDKRGTLSSWDRLEGEIGITKKQAEELAKVYHNAEQKDAK